MGFLFEPIQLMIHSFCITILSRTAQSIYFIRTIRKVAQIFSCNQDKIIAGSFYSFCQFPESAFICKSNDLFKDFVRSIRQFFHSKKGIRGEEAAQKSVFRENVCFFQIDTVRQAGLRCGFSGKRYFRGISFLIQQSDPKASGKGAGCNLRTDALQNQVFHMAQRMVKGKAFYDRKKKKQDAQAEQDPVLVQEK